MPDDPRIETVAKWLMYFDHMAPPGFTRDGRPYWHTYARVGRDLLAVIDAVETGGDDG